MSLDPIYEKLLIQVHKRASIHEMMEATGLKSPATIHQRLTRLERLGLVIPPPKPGQARSRTLSQTAIQHLANNGYLKKQQQPAAVGR